MYRGLKRGVEQADRDPSPAAAFAAFTLPLGGVAEVPAGVRGCAGERGVLVGVPAWHVKGRNKDDSENKWGSNVGTHATVPWERLSDCWIWQQQGSWGLLMQPVAASVAAQAAGGAAPRAPSHTEFL